MYAVLNNKKMHNIEKKEKTTSIYTDFFVNKPLYLACLWLLKLTTAQIPVLAVSVKKSLLCIQLFEKVSSEPIRNQLMGFSQVNFLK